MNPVLRPELRYRRLWFVVGLILAGIIAYVCLVPGKDLPEMHLWDKLRALAGLRGAGAAGSVASSCGVTSSGSRWGWWRSAA